MGQSLTITLVARAQTLDAQCLKDVQLACVYVNPKVLDALAAAGLAQRLLVLGSVEAVDKHLKSLGV